jgi:hypothetical protein
VEQANELEGHPLVRITTEFMRLLRLDDGNVTSVIWGTGVVTVVVALKRRRLWCLPCTFKTSAHYDRRWSRLLEKR